jgi:hypothetical protein
MITIFTNTTMFNSIDKGSDTPEEWSVIYITRL